MGGGDSAAASVVLAVVCCAVAGCGQPSDQERYARRIVEQYGALVALEATADPELRAELARIVVERGTPRHLCRPKMADDQNAAVVLRGLFESGQADALLGETAPLVGTGRLTWSPTDLERARVILAANHEPWRTWREAWLRPQCEFNLLHTAGYFADTSFIAQTRAGGRLELLHGVELMAADRLDEASDSVRLLLRGAAALADEDHVAARLEAAAMRGEALVLIELLAQHRLSDRVRQQGLADMLRETLATWPEEARLWRGDRALGMHVYETVRGGDLGALLTEIDIARLVEDGEVEHFAAAAGRSLDHDELVYLQVMRLTIVASRQPFHARHETLHQIADRLAELDGTPQHPLVAARLLLPGLTAAQRTIARDQAACLAWHAVLATACDRPTAPAVNPLDGEPLVVERGAGQVTIAGGAGASAPWPREIVVPVRRAAETDVARRPASQAGTADRPR